MGKFASAALIGFAATQALAQSTSVVSLFLLDTDPQSIAASVVGADASRTTYSLGCPTSADDATASPTPTGLSNSTDSDSLDDDDFSDDECGIYGLILTVGGSSWDAQASADGIIGASMHCDLTSSTIAGKCTLIASDESSSQPTTIITQPDSSDYAIMPVTITAGLEKLASASASATSGGSSAKATSSGSGSGSASPASSARASGASATGSAASSGASASSTGNAASNHGASMFGAAVGLGAAALML